ncbi:acetyl-CoA hydrolase/transferase family protein [Aestuariispira insulae]|uniref:Itaconate CoA-transferase n=1 Tax=Aestuariispira insulae TaxID=1461337 RepID=A0A3D9HRG3_9PROT|nr:acetyl-CoA hydrolase/transferase C-terminal domain-containing protein [Aestuariispira insulae]RED52097.1 itaconate CoA-transferase [Aestuariispira insulae]
MTEVESLYQQKLVSHDEAAARVPDRSNLILGMGVAMPPAFMAALAKRAHAGDLSLLKLYYMHSTPAAAETLLVPELMEVIKPHPLFMSSHDRALAEAGHKAGQDWVQFVPCVFFQAGRLLSEQITPDCIAITVSPMDKSGHFSLGTNADYSASVVRKAKRVIVEVNPQMPRTFGECLLHVSAVDHVIEHDTPLMEIGNRQACAEDLAIADLIAAEIPDGATIQMGVGAVPNAVMERLEGHKDLGLHSELFSPPMVRLIKKGVMNGATKTLLPHKHVFTLALGDREMFDFMDDNPSITGYPVSWVNNPAVIRKNKNLISVNAAIQVDLSGQVNSESINGREFSGTGGQLDFVRGAFESPGGKSFIALHSTAKGGSISRIVPHLAESTVTDPRMDTHYVVTEFGAVDMKGKSLGERARALINIAHPDFRDDLSARARERGLI